jgi:hypothetical protein
MKNLFKQLFKRKTPDEKTISILKFRENGDVDYDPKSKRPTFVEYNNVRLKIQLAKNRKERNVMDSLSVACWNELLNDGYQISNIGEDNDGYRHLIEW